MINKSNDTVQVAGQYNFIFARLANNFFSSLNMKFQTLGIIYMSHFVRKPDFCLCENKGTDQLGSNCEAVQGLRFHYTDSTIPLLSQSKISSL